MNSEYSNSNIGNSMSFIYTNRQFQYSKMTSLIKNKLLPLNHIGMIPSPDLGVQSRLFKCNEQIRIKLTLKILMILQIKIFSHWLKQQFKINIINYKIKWKVSNTRFGTKAQWSYQEASNIKHIILFPTLPSPAHWLFSPGKDGCGTSKP